MANLPKYIQDLTTFRGYYERVKKLRSSLQKRLDQLEGLENIKQKAEAKATSINQAKSLAEQSLSEIQTHKDKINDISAAIENEESGALAIQKQADAAMQKAAAAQSAAQESLDTAIRFKTETEKLHTENTKLLELLATGSISKFVSEETKHKNNWKIAWLVILIIFTVTLFVALFNIKRDNSSLANQVFMKYSFVGPLIYMIYFSAKQYSKESAARDKYAYKAVIAKSLRSFTRFLRNEFAVSEVSVARRNIFEDRIYKFAHDTIDRIHQEPYDNEESNKFIFSARAPFINADVVNVERAKNIHTSKGTEIDKSETKPEKTSS